MNERINIISNISERRKSLGMSVYKMSRITGMTEYQIRNIEKGNGFTIDSLIKICNFLGLNIKLTPIENEES